MCIFFLIFFFFFNDTATTEIYTLSDTLSYTTLFRSFNVNALRTSDAQDMLQGVELARSEEHTSELQSPLNISYAVFCLKKKKKVMLRCEADKARMAKLRERNARKAVNPLWITSLSGPFFFNDTATTEIYTLSDTLSLHDALPI